MREAKVASAFVEMIARTAEWRLHFPLDSFVHRESARAAAAGGCPSSAPHGPGEGRARATVLKIIARPIIARP